MPFKKRNKYLTLSEKAIKKRLMEISIYVDNYIYENTPITIEEAKSYAHEISLHRNKCYNNTHILQVIEKLTLCMKKIIEETTRNDETTDQKVTASDLVTIDVSGTNNIVDKSKTIEYYNNKAKKEAETINKHIESNGAVFIVICDEKNNDEDNKYSATSPVYKGFINRLPCESCNYNNIDNGNDLKSSKLYNHDDALKVINIDEKTNKLEVVNTTRFNKEKAIFSNNASKTEGNVNDNYNLFSENKGNIKTSKRRTIKNAKNLQKIYIDSLFDTNNRHAKKKTNQGKTQKPPPVCPIKDKSIRRVTNAPKKVKTTAKITKSRQPKNKSNKDLMPPINRHKNTDNKIVHSNFTEHNSSALLIPARPTLDESKRTNTDIIRNEVPVPVLSEIDYNISDEINKQDSISNQMGALKIYNEFVKNDLSWIEDIRYVRVINMDEFEPMSNSLHETFWDNFTLPDEWNSNQLFD